METIELERNYRAACQKMLSSLDLRTAMNRINEEIGRLHQSLAVEGAQILADPANDASIASYRAMVEKVVAKLDERDQLRQKDGFKGALQDLLQLGEQLGYARKAEPAPLMVVPPTARYEPSEFAHFETRPARPVIVKLPVEQASRGDSGFGSVEKELAELQQQLVELQHS